MAGPWEDYAPRAEANQQEQQGPWVDYAPGQLQSGSTTARGVAKQVAAGVVGAGGSVGDVVADPVASLVLRPLATAGMFAYDAVAPLFGANRLSPQFREAVLGETGAGTHAIGRIGEATGINPNPTPATPVERGVRAGVQGGLSAAAFGPASPLTPAMGVGGAVAGDVARQYAPEWAADAADLAANVAAGKAVQTGSSLVTKGVNRALGNTTPLVDAFDRLGIDKTLVGDVSGSSPAKGLQAYSSQAPGGASRVLGREKVMVDQFGKAIGDTATQLGTSTNATAAGNVLQTSARDWVDNVFPARQQAAWTPVDRLMVNAAVEPTAYRNALTGVTSKLSALPETQKALLPPKVQAMLDAINTDVPPGSAMTWQQAQQLRSAIGGVMGVPEIVQSVGKDNLKAAYGGISRDMQQAAKQAGADQLFADANRVSTEGHAFIENTLSKIIKANNPLLEKIAPDKAVDAVLGSGDAALTALRREIPKALDEIAGYKLRDMATATPGRQGAAGTGFSVGTFLTELNKLRQNAPNGFAALYGHPSVSGKMDDLALVADSIKDTATRLNVSRTGPFQTMSNLGGGLGTAGLVYGLTENPLSVGLMAAPFAVNNLLARGVANTPLTNYVAAPGPRVLPNPLATMLTSSMNQRNRLGPQ